MKQTIWDEILGNNWKRYWDAKHNLKKFRLPKKAQEYYESIVEIHEKIHHIGND